MNSPFKSDIVVDGTLASTNAKLKWEKVAISNAMKLRIKGKPLFVHSRKENKYILNYYQSYGRDFCDATFVGEIFEYDEGGSQITGKVTASTSVKRFGLGLIALSLPLAFVFNEILHLVLPGSREPIQELFAFSGAALALIVIAIMCFIVDKRRVKEIMEYLNKFLQEEEQDNG
jgi:hypothetical protein